MAIELATGYVSLVPSASGFSRALARELTGPLENAGSDAGERTSRTFGRTFVAGVGAAATRGALALSAGFTLAAGIGIKIAADFEQTQIAFEGVLGSADEAKSVLGDLRDFAARTPFEFTGLTESAQQLLGLGFAADDIIPLMGTLGDVAAALGAGEPEIKGVVRALGQIKGKGKVSAEELQQISEQLPGFSAINAIAQEMGITTAEAFDRMAKGAIPADEGIAAILEGMKKFPGASGAMERQSKTLNGVISTFKDTLATTAIDFITPYLPAISSGVAALGGFIQNVAVPALQDFISFISDHVGPGVQTLIDAFHEDGLGGMFEALGRGIQENGPILGQKLLEMGQAFIDWIAPLVPPALEALAGWLGDIAVWAGEEGAPKLGEAAQKFIPPLIDWVENDVIPGLVGEDGALWKMLKAWTEWLAEEGVPAFFRGGQALGSGLIRGIFKGLSADFDDVNKEKLDLGPLGEFEIPVGLRASGGPVTAGMPYVVGEKRPELFVPERNGYIIPQVPYAGAGGAGGAVHLHVTSLPGEDVIDRGMRELRWHRQVQLAVSSR